MKATIKDGLGASAPSVGVGTQQAGTKTPQTPIVQAGMMDAKKEV